IGSLLLATALARTVEYLLNSGGLHEILTPECAILTEPGDVESLTSGLQSALDMISNGDERTDQLRTAARRVAESYTPDVVAARLEGFYDEALALAAGRT
ncbi:MAG: hypothetical protein P8Z69_05545, partial [Acidihalobacter sp.]